MKKLVEQSEKRCSCNNKTKFDIGQQVFTPISDRTGSIKDIRIDRITQHYGQAHYGLCVRVSYLVTLSFPIFSQSKFQSYDIIFDENELKAAS